MLLDIDFLALYLPLVLGTAGVISLIKICVTVGTVLLLRRTFPYQLLERHGPGPGR